MKATVKTMVKNQVARGKNGDDTQNGNKAAPQLAKPGVAKGKTKDAMVKNAVASGKGSPAGQKKPVQNGSTNRGQSQQVGTKTNGGVGTPGKMLGLDDGALKTISNHGAGNAKSGSNRFDLYAAARK